MGRTSLRISIAVLVAAALSFVPFLVEACGPDLSAPTLTGYHSPDIPIDQYSRGRLGLLQPGYVHICLYVAYRNLIGKPLTDAEIAAIGQPAPPSYLPSPPQTGPNQPPNWVDAWKQARQKVPGVSRPAPNFGFYTDTGVFRISPQGDLTSYYNCMEGAYQYALQTLDQRIAQFGAQSPYVQQWLDAQDQVFDNCRGAAGYPPQQPAAVIPAAASSTDPLEIRQDRAYQIAAAHFYAGDLDLAKPDFEAIANDPASPYRKLSAYLVARVLVREGTLEAGVGKFDAQKLGKAERRLESILADRNLAEYHSAARRLLGYVRIRLYPQQRMRELESALLSRQANPDFGQNLTDYLWLLDRQPRDSEPAASATAQLAQETAAAAEPGDMTDWIDTFPRAGPAAFRHSLQKWQQTGSVPWLVAAISQAPANNSAAADLEAAAAKLTPDSPAYVTAAFHRLRLLAEADRRVGARAGIDSLLASAPPALSPAARNEFLALRMSLATSPADWLRFAPRRPVDMGGYAYVRPAGGSPPSKPDILDSDASIVLTEKLPLSLLAEAAESRSLPPSLREEIAIAAWTRAVVLHDTILARHVSPVLASLEPELRPSLDAFTSAASAFDRDFAAAFLLLRFPGMRPFVPAGLPRWSVLDGPQPLSKIDTFRNNWWCQMSPPPSNVWQENYYTMYAKLSEPLGEIYAGGKVPSPAFLSESERAAATQQWSALQALPTAPDWLGKIALEWAQAHPRDPRVPEALHLVVRAGHYGCGDAKTPDYSRRAFTLLHARYPSSPWTKRTTYWFK